MYQLGRHVSLCGQSIRRLARFSSTETTTTVTATATADLNQNEQARIDIMMQTIQTTPGSAVADRALLSRKGYKNSLAQGKYYSDSEETKTDAETDTDVDCREKNEKTRHNHITNLPTQRVSNQPSSTIRSYARVTPGFSISSGPYDIAMESA